ncbi:hypothetical protein F1559_004988 [Cyanidiococcus yangmingshanensis]|uniref:C2 NT-type domain-containing protein n=1 Tax=Cyanidiococcus yangmingshanensis TaxID=2690220 RepID=A0A7J7IQN9_9RHOD|nr:hypothetical protein F1559_004988 [Cyanidiococcus yangmingshanensis]
MQIDRRKRVFQVHLDLYELVAVPDSTGVFHVKVKACTQGFVRQRVHWRGFTSDRLVENHRVIWNESLHFRATLAARSTATETLLPYLLCLKVKRTIPFGRTTQTVCVGELTLDLAQYAGIEGPHTTRLPLEKTTTNALLRFTLTMRQTEGSNAFQRHGLARHILSTQASSEFRTLSFDEGALESNDRNTTTDDNDDDDENSRAIEDVDDEQNSKFDATPGTRAHNAAGSIDRDLGRPGNEEETTKSSSPPLWPPMTLSAAPGGEHAPTSARQPLSPVMLQRDHSSGTTATDAGRADSDKFLQRWRSGAHRPYSVSMDSVPLLSILDSSESTTKAGADDRSSAESMSTAPEESSFDEQSSPDWGIPVAKEDTVASWFVPVGDRTQPETPRSTSASVESASKAAADRFHRQARFAARLLGLTLEDDSENTLSSRGQVAESRTATDRTNRLWRTRRTQSVVPQLERTGPGGPTRPKTIVVSHRRQHSRSSSSRGPINRTRGRSSGSKPDFSLSQIVDHGLDKYVAVLAAEMRHERLIPDSVRETRADVEGAVSEVLRRLARTSSMTPIVRRSGASGQRLGRLSNASVESHAALPVEEIRALSSEGMDSA